LGNQSSVIASNLNQDIVDFGAGSVEYTGKDVQVLSGLGVFGHGSTKQTQQTYAPQVKSNMAYSRTNDSEDDTAH